MPKVQVSLFFLLMVVFSTPSLFAAEKEWTVLVFLNGHNNLDSYGTLDMLEMEKQGSSEQVNVVVQWASLQANTKRLLVQKSTKVGEVTSPIVEELPPVDMGDYKSLVEFVRWGAAHYPARRYFVVLWNHGSGWRRRSADLSARDISSDDRTGSVITTEQLGPAMGEIAGVLGRKLDLLGADACLMSMAEVASELAQNVDFFVGSQEVEPGEGWPYDKFLEAFYAGGDYSPQFLIRSLTKTFLESYSGGTQGRSAVTLSGFDLSEYQNLSRAIASYGQSLLSIPESEKGLVQSRIRSAQRFYYYDFVDVLDLSRVIRASTTNSRVESASQVLQGAVNRFVISNQVSAEYIKASGVSIWMPTDTWTFQGYGPRYEKLQFNLQTQWYKVVEMFNRPPGSTAFVN